jgi:hypothetical protein
LCTLKKRDAGLERVFSQFNIPENEGVQTITKFKRGYPDLNIICISSGGRARNLDFLVLA